tara:strand:- start:54 stop:638 length:585 start_codon:yes stop_codon:yes gene_type:complete
MILEIDLFNKFDYPTFMKNIIFISFIFFHSTIIGQNNWTLYPKKDTILERDSVAIAKSDSLMSDSSITKEIPLKQKKDSIHYISSKGHIVIRADYRIDSINSYISNKGKFNGYAVQLIVTQDTRKIREMRKTFTNLFPGEYLFDEYIAPNIFLYAGKYFSKNDAVTLNNKLSAHFKNTMVIRKKFPLKHIQKEK